MSAQSSESGQQSDFEIGRPRLLQRVHEAIRVRYYSWRTEEAYVRWIKRYIIFNGKRHPETMGEAEVTAFAPAPHSRVAPAAMKYRFTRPALSILRAAGRNARAAYLH